MRPAPGLLWGDAIRLIGPESPHFDMDPMPGGTWLILYRVGGRSGPEGEGVTIRLRRVAHGVAIFWE